MLKKLIDGRWLSASAVVGLYPANRSGADDITLYADEARSQPLLTWHGLRQQTEKQMVDGAMRPSRCLADFVAPAGTPDYVGLFAVTAGLGVEKKSSSSSTPTTTTAPSCSRPWPTAWPKPWPSVCTNGCAKISGVTHPTRR